MNFWQRLRCPDPKEYFLKFSPHSASFVSVSWNFDLKNPSHRQTAIEIHQHSKEVIEWKKSSGEEVSFFENDKLKSHKKISGSRPEYTALMNIAMHSTIKSALESHQEFMLTPVSGATTQDFQSEAKSLQWIQASFGTLSRVLKKFPEVPSLILTAAFFSGVTPETQEKVVRLIAFNLDVIFYLRPDFSLQVIVFDDRNMGHGGSNAPTFQQIIKVTKPQFYDEMVKLTNQLAHVGDLK